MIERLLYAKEGQSYAARNSVYCKTDQNRLGKLWKIYAESLDEYTAAGGFSALEKALFEMTPEQVVEEVDLSGLREVVEAVVSLPVKNGNRSQIKK